MNIKNKKQKISLITAMLLITMAFLLPIGLSTQPSQNIQLTYTIHFKEPTFTYFSYESNSYTIIHQKGTIAVGQHQGAPRMPVKPIKLMLPPQTTVKEITIDATPVSIDTSSLNLHNNPVLPYQNPTPIGLTQEQPFVTDTALYAQNIQYPTDPCYTYNIGHSHGYAILDITLNTMQYNPAQETLSYYPEMTININLKPTEQLNKFYRNNPDDKAYTQSLVSNPEIADIYPSLPHPTEYPGGLCDPADHYDYVIITTTHNGLDYWETDSSTPYNWDSLMDKHQTDNGLSCTLVTIQDITDCEDYHSSDPLFNDQCAHIREFCKDAYEDWGTQYILIGGDDEWIAARHMHSSYEGNIDSDIYWSNLDRDFNADHDYLWGEEGDLGFDVYCELFIGRLTCDEPQDISNWMTKSFYYDDAGDMDYLENAAFYGGQLGWPTEGDDFIDYAAIKGTDNWLGPNPGDHGPYPDWLGFQYGFETWNKESPSIPYDLSVKWSATAPNPSWQGGSTSTAIAGLKNDINNDQVTLLSGVAHAASYMSLDVYDSTWESQYHNTMPFFITDFGCHCGDMDASDDGVLHSMLFHSDTELAFACVYNTCYGWGSFYDTNSSSALQMKSFWDYMFDIENNSIHPGNWQLGKGHAWSKDVMAPTINWTYSSAPGSWRAVIEGCLLFGDPAQRLKTTNAPPDKPQIPDGPTEGITNVDYTFTTSSTEPEGEDLYFKFNWGDNTTSNWIGPHGSGEEASATHQWPDKGTYQITVKARDENGGESPWSTPLEIGILDGPILDMGLFNSKIVKVGLDIRNRGAAPATNVNWRITCDGGMILMGQETTGTIETIAPGESAEITSGLIFGFGKIDISAYAEILEGSDTREQTANVFLFFVKVVPGGG